MNETTADPEKLLLIEKLAAAGQQDYESLGLSDLARITNMPESCIKNHFQNVDEWIDAFYCFLVEQYRAMLMDVPDYDQYTVGEKLLNFGLSSMDLMRENYELVGSTFYPFIFNRFTSTRFEKLVEEMFREFTEQDGRVALSNQLVLISPVYTIWSREYLNMINYWVQHPGSEQKVMGLMEKSATLLNEILYNGVFDKAFDLGKYVINNEFLSLLTPLSVARRIFRF